LTIKEGEEEKKEHKEKYMCVSKRTTDDNIYV
jgi:hypothetical protein